MRTIQFIPSEVLWANPISIWRDDRQDNQCDIRIAPLHFILYSDTPSLRHPAALETRINVAQFQSTLLAQRCGPCIL